jgi:hypothetical protein
MHDRASAVAPINQICISCGLPSDASLRTENGGYTRTGADRVLVTECHPALGPISRGSLICAGGSCGRDRAVRMQGARFCVALRWCYSSS